ncbi:nitrate reductase [Serratia sp. S1B]|nr:nitrate reductase [Serratia sp. S1B]
MLAIVPRILGCLFYYPPDSEAAQCALRDLPQLVNYFPWQHPEVIRNISQHTAQPQPDTFSLLFEGVGDMQAPPWGSVYLDPERIVMGCSTLDYRHFLRRNGIAPRLAGNEPEDHFGLMLLALAYLLEQEREATALELLNEHLFPWAGLYLQQLKSATLAGEFYHCLATLAQHFIAEMRSEVLSS